MKREKEKIVTGRKAERDGSIEIDGGSDGGGSMNDGVFAGKYDFSGSSCSYLRSPHFRFTMILTLEFRV